MSACGQPDKQGDEARKVADLSSVGTQHPPPRGRFIGFRHLPAQNVAGIDESVVGRRAGLPHAGSLLRLRQVPFSPVMSITYRRANEVKSQRYVLGGTYAVESHGGTVNVHLAPPRQIHAAKAFGFFVRLLSGLIASPIPAWATPGNFSPIDQRGFRQAYYAHQ